MTPSVRADSHLTPEERARALQWLEQSRQWFLESIRDLSHEQWTWKPVPAAWSIAETSEHIVLAEAVLFSCVQKAVASAANPAWEEQTRGKTEFIERVMAPRLGKAQAPQPLIPQGRMTQAEVRERFEAQRAVIAAFASETNLALKEHTLEHPFPVFGVLNAYQWLIYLPLHTMRHCKQILEMKAAPGYPAGGLTEP